MISPRIIIFISLFLSLQGIEEGKQDLVEEEYLPSPIDIPFDYKILPNMYQLSPNSNQLFMMISDPKAYKVLVNKYIHIGLNDYLIKENIGSGAEGVVYVAEDFNHKQVVIKALLDFKGARESYNNEIHGLKKLSRLYDQDPEHMIIVQEKISGLFYDEVYDAYVENHGGTSDYPSNIIPSTFKDKFFQILYDFRNLTNMTHNDFRPYNIVNDTVIDFGRSEELSSDPLKRQKQIDTDDKTAQEEWDYFVARRDVKAIEKNPFLPNARDKANDAWKLYEKRYASNKNTLQYKKDWMEVLEYILMNNDTTVDFPYKSAYE